MEQRENRFGKETQSLFSVRAFFLFFEHLLLSCETGEVNARERRRALMRKRERERKGTRRQKKTATKKAKSKAT